MLSSLAPLLGLVYLGVGMSIFTIPVARNKVGHVLFLIVSGLVPAFQSYLLLAEPKLCPACLTITLVSAGYFLAMRRTIFTDRLQGMIAPGWMRGLFSVLLIALIVRHSLVLAGYVSAGKPPEQKVPRIIGTSLRSFAPSLSSVEPGLVYVITIPGCHACQECESQLARAHIEWQSVSVCAMARNAGCFDPKGTNFPAPLLLMYDHTGRVIFQHEGSLGSSQEVADLKEQIHGSQRRILQLQQKQ